MNLNEYIYGVQCGDTDCYSCATQRYNCDELTRKDNLEDGDVGGPAYPNVEKS